MPHSTRRRNIRPPPTNASKRTTVPLSDGWSVITTKMGQASLDSSASVSAHTPLALVPSAPIMDTAKLLQVYEKSRQRWRETRLAEQLRVIIMEAVDQGSGAEAVDKALVAGLGSLSCGGENGWRSMWQVVMYLDVVGILETRKEEEKEGDSIEQKEEERKIRKIKMYAQDPAFNDVDEVFLAELGIEVIHEPENIDKDESAKNHAPTSTKPAASAHLITPSTFFFAPCMPWALLWPQYLHNKDRDPALFISNDVAQIIDENVPKSGQKKSEQQMGDKEVLSAVMRFMAGEGCVNYAAGPESKVRVERKMPDFELSQGFEGMMIYWRKGDMPGQDD